MATLSINNMFAKGFKNKTSGTKMVWWKTNFNMPVPNIFDNNTTFTKSQGMLDPLDEGTTFDLSGYNQGWEVIAAATIFVFEGEITDFGLVTIKQKWIRPDGYSPWENSYNLAIQEQASGQWQGWQLASNQGVAPWEINQSGTYELEVSMSGAYNMTKSFYVTFTNVPSFTGYKTPGYIWVEGDDLKYVSANGFVHTVEGTNVGAVGGDPGSIWIESTGSNNFHYINDGGDNNIAPWKIEQFASVFSGGATSAVSGESPGYLYADNEFGFTHLSYIGNDGKKYLIGDGHYPYTNPY